MNWKKAFTLIEAIITMSIAVVVVAGVILAMTRGASNVQKGSFTMQACNQAAWISMWLRKDLTCARLAEVKMGTGASQWDGSNGNLEVPFLDKAAGKAVYELKKLGNGKALVRMVKGKERVLAREILHELKINRIAENDFKIEILMKDPAKHAKDFAWEGRIFPPCENSLAKYWKK